MLPPSLKHLMRDQCGATAILIAVMGLVLFGFVSLGSEVVDALMTQRRMQAGADSAAISAANAKYLGVPASYQQEAYAIAAADGFTAGQGAACTANPTVYAGPPCAGDPTASLPICTGSNACVEVMIQRPFTLRLANLVTVGDFTLHARSVATVPSSSSGGSCTLALQQNGTTITASGGAQVTYTGCSVAANSTSANAINTNGTNSLIVGTGVYTGGSENWASMNVQAPSAGNACSTSNSSCFSNAPAQLNPYDNITVPSSSCVGAYLNAPNSGTIGTVGATVNCYNGFSVNGGKEIDFTPGTYVINGSITMTNNGILRCPTCVAGTSGVTIFLVGANATVNITGGTTDLFAQPSGPYAGLLFYSASTCNMGNCGRFTGGSTMTVQGAIVFPSQNISFSGNTSLGNNVCAVLISNTLTFTGTSNVGNSGCSSTFHTQTVAVPSVLIE